MRSVFYHTQLCKKNCTEHLIGIRIALSKHFPYASFNFLQRLDVHKSHDIYNSLLLVCKTVDCEHV